MSPRRLIPLAMLLGFLCCVDPLAAQFPTQPSGYRPPLSPYLNLLNGGNPATNYFFFVAPRTVGPATRQAMQDPQVVRQFNLDAPEDQIPVLPETGHTVRFFNYGPYFNLGNAPRSQALYPYRPKRTK